MPASSEQIAARLIACPPRILRASAAPAYLGMCRTEFNKTVRPYVREFRIGCKASALIAKSWMPGQTPTSTGPSLKRKVPRDMITLAASAKEKSHGAKNH